MKQLEGNNSPFEGLRSYTGGTEIERRAEKIRGQDGMCTGQVSMAALIPIIYSRTGRGIKPPPITHLFRMKTRTSKQRNCKTSCEPHKSRGVVKWIGFILRSLRSIRTVIKNGSVTSGSTHVNPVYFNKGAPSTWRLTFVQLLAKYLPPCGGTRVIMT